MHPNYLNSGESKVIAEMMDLSYEESGRVVLSATLRNLLLVKIIDYYSLHLGISLQVKSLEVLHELFS
jgi:DNA repair protein RecO (recombination protein O)